MSYIDTPSPIREALAAMIEALRTAAEPLPDPADAWVWFEETRAVTAIGPDHPRGAPETYPFGL